VTQHVLFDLDGTVTDSAPGITRCLAHAIRAAGGRPPPSASLRSFIGTPLREIFHALLPAGEHGRIATALEAYIDRFNRIGIRENSVYPGIVEALEALRDDGCELHIATAKGADVARKILAMYQLDSMFHAVFGAEPERGITAKADILRLGLDSLGIPCSVATMVGDRDHDIEAALRLGIRSIGVTWGYGTPSELSSAHAIAHAPDALPSLIRGAA
jgi:phosphoglycolate phosphatase